MKKKQLYLVGLAILLFLLSTSSARVFSSGIQYVPQFMLIMVIGYALGHSFVETLWFSFAAGLFSEFYSGFFFGSQIAALVIVGLAVYAVTRKYTTMEVSFLAASLIVVVSTLVFVLCIFGYAMMISLFGGESSVSMGDLLRVNLVWTALANLIVFYPVFSIFKYLADERSF